VQSRWFAALGAVAALMVTGCGGQSEPDAPVPSVAPASPTTAGGDAQASPPASPTQTSGSFTITELPTDQDYSFLSPTGNIGCVMSSQSVRCDIVERTYPDPPRPPGCELAYGNTLFLDAAGAQPGCVGDTIISPGAPTLGYGTGRKMAGFTCTMAEVGVRCENASGSGFALARSTFETFS
jgi:hypothetical protein